MSPKYPNCAAAPPQCTSTGAAPLRYLAAVELSVELLLSAYLQGIFPMADPDTGEVNWFCPERRGVIPLDAFHVPFNLKRAVRKGSFEVTSDQAFEEVIRLCATDRSSSNRSWISDALIEAYIQLHERGYAHSVEARLEGRLVGGLYGVHIGGAFFGESMFSRPDYGGTNASKVCLVHLVEHMRRRGFTLLDTQFVNPHLEQFGCIEISHKDYLRRLEEAVAMDVTWGEVGGTGR